MSLSTSIALCCEGGAHAMSSMPSTHCQRQNTRLPPPSVCAHFCSTYDDAMHALPAVAQPAPSSVFADNMVLLLYTRA